MIFIYAKLDCCDEEGAEPQDKAFSLLVYVQPSPVVMSSEDEVTNTSGQN